MTSLVPLLSFGKQTIARSMGHSTNFINGTGAVDLSFFTVLCAVIYLLVHASRWGRSARWVLTGPQVLAKKYESGMPFTIQTPGRQYIIVSSEAHIRELSEATEDRLSLVATADEVFQPVHTMNGVELNRLGMQHRILRSLTLRLPSLQSPLTSLVQEALGDELNGKKSLNGWTSLNIFKLAQRTIAKTNTYTFYGQEFTKDYAFLEAAIQYPQDVFVAAEALRCAPGFLAPLASHAVTRGHKASKLLVSRLVPMIERRIEGERLGTTKAPLDYVQHIIKHYPEDTADRALKIVQQTLALWFASVHQPAMTLVYALVDLCLRPDFVSVLQQEIEDNLKTSALVDLNKLPLLDSFLKESARMHASESISLRRKAMKPYAFNDGTHVPLGDWVCVPQRALMRDPAVYFHADVFDGARFVRNSSMDSQSTKLSKYTDLHPRFPFWGLGRHACPGRFYASFVMKVALVEIIQNYDIKLKDVTACRTITWRSSILPFPTLTFDIRVKDIKCHGSEVGMQSAEV